MVTQIQPVNKNPESYFGIAALASQLAVSQWVSWSCQGVLGRATEIAGELTLSGVALEKKARDSIILVVYFGI